MIIINKKSFYTGISLLLGFCVIFYFLLTPCIPDSGGERLTGLQYSDKVFNELSKGSSNFIHLAAQAADEMLEKEISPSFKFPKTDLSNLQETFLKNAGSRNILWEKDRLSFQTDLGILLEQATEDAQLLYFNQGEKLSSRYDSADPLQIAKAWWQLLDSLQKNLMLNNRNSESKAVSVIIRRAIEPGNNYFGIPILNIAQNIPLISMFLLFYIIYTVWYGFAVYEIFNGLGLMSSAEEMEEKEEMSC